MQAKLRVVPRGANEELVTDGELNGMHAAEAAHAETHNLAAEGTS
jgi:hypothetical protein